MKNFQTEVEFQLASLNLQVGPQSGIIIVWNRPAGRPTTSMFEVLYLSFYWSAPNFKTWFMGSSLTYAMGTFVRATFVLITIVTVIQTRNFFEIKILFWLRFFCNPKYVFTQNFSVLNVLNKNCQPNFSRPRISFSAQKIFCQIFGPIFATLGLHIGFSAELKIWQISTCKMEPWSGYMLYYAVGTTPPNHHISWKSESCNFVLVCTHTLEYCSFSLRYQTCVLPH